MKQTNEALFSISGFQMSKQIMNTYGNHFSKIALTKTQTKAAPRLKEFDERELAECSTSSVCRLEPGF